MILTLDLFLVLLHHGDHAAVDDDAAVDDHAAVDNHGAVDDHGTVHVHGVVGDLPPCFTNGTTWHFEDMEDIIPSIESPFQCQDLCAASNCSGFTWYSEKSSHFTKMCALYHSLLKQESCTDCISGPVSCTCSSSFSCDMTSDNVIDIVASVDTETRCQNLCFNTPDCNFYTYYNELNLMQESCFLFKSCDLVDESCEGCFSGPSVCSASTTSTTNSPTASNTFTTTISTTSSYTPCSDITYSTLSDSTRNVNHGWERYCDQTGSLDISPDWKGPGWYRMQGPAGDKILEYPPEINHCGTFATGWLRDDHPQNLYEEVMLKVCWNWARDTCFSTTEVKVKNCGEYYLYNLPDAPDCDSRYCAV